MHSKTSSSIFPLSPIPCWTNPHWIPFISQIPSEITSDDSRCLKFTSTSHFHLAQANPGVLQAMYASLNSIPENSFATILVPSYSYTCRYIRINFTYANRFSTQLFTPSPILQYSYSPPNLGFIQLMNQSFIPHSTSIEEFNTNPLGVETHSSHCACVTN